MFLKSVYGLFKCSNIEVICFINTQKISLDEWCDSMRKCCQVFKCSALTSALAYDTHITLITTSTVITACMQLQRNDWQIIIQ